MRVLDAGHYYELDRLDGPGVEMLQFVKREGEGYLGNVGHCPGTNMQEVIRALIDRCKYLDAQIPCVETVATIAALRTALLLLELRAARRHGREWTVASFTGLENFPVCERCGHIGCHGECHADERMVAAVADQR